MGKSLVIVESPAKARTIAGYLGERLRGRFERGPRPRPSEIARRTSRGAAEALRRTRRRRQQGLRAVLRRRSRRRRRRSAELKKHLADADELLLATDEDREGEAIAWHLVEVLKPKVPVRRMVFHEITKDAIARALDETRSIDDRLVDAQETRRILDRLYGYEVSPVLWKKVTRGLSAGRVQSVATRLVVAARARADGVPVGRVLGSPRHLRSWRLRGAPGRARRRSRRAGQGLRADDGPARARAASSSSTRRRARSLAERLADVAVRRSLGRREAVPAQAGGAVPDATLQQEASRKLRFSAQTTMRVAQRLYETGYITYMRTDSTTLSESALDAARAQVAELFGEDFVPAKPRRYGRAVANAQEAHEAIRPAGDSVPDAEASSKASSIGTSSRSTTSIWKRTLASQMEDARGQTVSLRIGGDERGRRGRRVRRVGHGDHVPRLPRRVRAGAGRADGRRRGARAAAARGRPGR